MDKDTCPKDICLYKRYRAGISCRMVQCDNCKQWYHQKCVSVTKKQAETVIEWLCKRCND